MKRTLLGLLGLGFTLVAFGGCASQAIHADIQGTDIVIPLDSAETTGTGVAFLGAGDNLGNSIFAQYLASIRAEDGQDSRYATGQSDAPDQQD